MGGGVDGGAEGGEGGERDRQTDKHTDTQTATDEQANTEGEQRKTAKKNHNSSTEGKNGMVEPHNKGDYTENKKKLISLEIVTQSNASFTDIFIRLGLLKLSHNHRRTLLDVLRKKGRWEWG